MFRMTWNIWGGVYDLYTSKSSKLGLALLEPAEIVLWKIGAIAYNSTGFW